MSWEPQKEALEACVLYFNKAFRNLSPDFTQNVIISKLRGSEVLQGIQRVAYTSLGVSHYVLLVLSQPPQGMIDQSNLFAVRK